MNRIELVEKIAANHGLSKAGADRIIDDVFQSIVAAVKKGDGFGYVGFGSFKTVARAARKGRNPLTGEDVKIPATKVPKFVAGAAFKAAIDPKAAARKAEKVAGRQAASRPAKGAKAAKAVKGAKAAGAKPAAKKAGAKR